MTWNLWYEVAALGQEELESWACLWLPLRTVLENAHHGGAAIQQRTEGWRQALCCSPATPEPKNNAQDFPLNSQEVRICSVTKEARGNRDVMCVSRLSRGKATLTYRSGEHSGFIVREWFGHGPISDKGNWKESYLTVVYSMTAQCKVPSSWFRVCLYLN